MCRAFNAEMILLHVIDPHITGLTPLGMLPTPSTDEGSMERVREETTDLLSRLGTEFPRVRMLIREGPPQARAGTGKSKMSQSTSPAALRCRPSSSPAMGRGWDAVRSKSIRHGER